MLRKFSRLLSLALVLPLFACEDGTGPRAGGDGGFTLLLTDAPGDFEAAVVTISEIRLHGEGGDVVLLDDPYTVDLLELRNEVATVVQGFDVPAGTYSELRLILEGAYIEVETASGSEIFASSPDYEGLPPGADVDGELHMPSMGQSGLKVKLPGGNLDIGDEDVVVMIDFDVEESFGHRAGRSGRWIMHPVIRATDVTFGGNVLARLRLGDGVVLPELLGAAVTLADFTVQLTPAGGGTTRTGELIDVDEDGTFEFMFKGLVPGAYELGFVGPAGLIVTFSPLLPITVNVVERETATETVTISAAELAGSITATLELGSGITLPNVGGDVVTLAQFQAQLTPQGGSASTVTFTDADTNGTFEATFAPLAAGDYSLTVLEAEGLDATFDITLPASVTLDAGEAETVAIVVTGAALP